MNNFVFKIFGIPTAFQLYQGSGNEIGYFQNFYNGSKKNRKLTIHRMASGKVSFSYLRYNFISSGGRPNSFFGMSVVFDNEYCKDIQKIFDLFDAVYKGVILKNGILLTELKGNPTAQAKYLVRSFAEAEGEVKNVENNIINNLKNHFANDILPLDNTFLESNSMVKLNDKMGNAAFLNALRKCSWVNISSEYSTNEEPIPNPEFLTALDSTIEKVQTQILPVSVRIANKENVQQEVNALLNGIQNSLEKIDVWVEKEYKQQKRANLNEYLQKQPELKRRYEKLLEFQKSMNDLLKVIETPASKPQPPTTSGDADSNNDDISTSGKSGSIGGQKPSPTTNGDADSNNDDSTSGESGSNIGGQKPSPKFISSLFNKYKQRIIAIAIVITIIFLSILILKPNDKSSGDTGISSEETPALPPVENTIEDNGDFLQYWWDKALAADSENKYQDAIKYIDEAAKYNNDRYGVDAFKEEVQKKIDAAAAAEQKRKDDAAKQAKTLTAANTGINITVTDVNHNVLSNNVVKYDKNTATFRVKVSDKIGTGQWSSNPTDNVKIEYRDRANTRVIITNPDDNQLYTLIFTVKNKSNSVTIKTKKTGRAEAGI